MPAVTVTLRKSFPRRAGLGAGGHGRMVQPQWGSSLPTVSTNGGATTTSTGSTTTSTQTGPSWAGWSGNPGRRGRPQQLGTTSVAPGTEAYSQAMAPTAADLQAFQQALATAAQYGVVSTTQAAQYQSSANSASDAQIQQLTAQLNQLIASAPTAATVAASVAAGTPTTSTSWLDEQTSILGTEVTNSTLLIGAVVLLGGLYFVTRKK